MNRLYFLTSCSKFSELYSSTARVGVEEYLRCWELVNDGDFFVPIAELWGCEDKTPAQLQL